MGNMMVPTQKNFEGLVGPTFLAVEPGTPCQTSFFAIPGDFEISWAKMPGEGPQSTGEDRGRPFFSHKCPGKLGDRGRAESDRYENRGKVTSPGGTGLEALPGTKCMGDR